MQSNTEKILKVLYNNAYEITPYDGPIKAIAEGAFVEVARQILRDLQLSDEPQPQLQQADGSSSRAEVVYECQSVLLKQMHDMTHVNGYPSEAVPRATILSLPQLMDVPKRPIA